MNINEIVESESRKIEIFGKQVEIDMIKNPTLKKVIIERISYNFLFSGHKDYVEHSDNGGHNDYSEYSEGYSEYAKHNDHGGRIIYRC